MVDIYGRAGQLDKALEIIHVSFCHEDPVLWRTLLGSCKIIHRNLELEEVAIYEETDAAQGFQCRGLLPGWSWIEIDDQVHKFVGVSSNMDLIGQLGVTQSGVYSHMVVELSAVESSICYSKPLSVKMTPQRNKRRETQQPSPQHEPNMQSSSFLAYPPGYRFVPTDAEIIYYYLKPFLPENKKSWPIIPIHHANIYESNPQQLTGMPQLVLIYLKLPSEILQKVDHALKIHLTARGIKREVEEEEDEKRKRKKKEGGVEAPKEELEQLINSHQNSDNDDSFFTGFVDTHLLHIDIESSVSNCCLKKSSDEN
uniref:NAC domain-containing protein n=1 Tax=Brassica oleracea var. oleracea TaxID=109376 RepID=A0A0D3BXI4_BRAOL